MTGPTHRQTHGLQARRRYTHGSASAMLGAKREGDGWEEILGDGFCRGHSEGEGLERAWEGALRTGGRGAGEEGDVVVRLAPELRLRHRRRVRGHGVIPGTPAAWGRQGRER